MSEKRKRKINIFSLAAGGLIIILHLLLAYLLFDAMKYVELDRTAVYCVFGIVICCLIIIDLLYYVGTIYKTKSLSVCACVFALILLAVGGVGTFAISKVDATLNNVVDTEEEANYEVIRVAYATYGDSSITELKDLNGKIVGSLKTIGVSAASVGKQKIVDEGVNASYSEYSMTSDLFNALVEGDIDAAIFPNVYRTQLSADGYDDLLKNTVNFFEYEEKVQTNSAESSKKDLSTDPFTVLLIGYAPEAGGGGLTDTIILASINPGTMQVSMTSIARDSYVPIACYGGSRSKINDAGAASNACLMETVSDLMNVDIDFYMKVNFQGVVDIVDALGGVYINSPVEFTGQSSSSTRGQYNVWVPAGEYVANGEQALAFARERHAMPNGDFDRQIHQQEVIREIAQRLIALNDVSSALKILEVAGDNFSTNLSVSQLTKVFNYLVSSPNYSGQSQGQLVDIKMSRLTGYTYWFYSYSARLPLWSYYLYDGSIKENVRLSKDVLNDFDNIKQDKKMNILINFPYIRDAVYSTVFNEPHVPEDMPAYYPRLTSYSYDQARVWAAENGVSINWNVISEGMPGYSASAVGSITNQEPRYGALVSEYPSCTLTVIGAPLAEEDRVPNFVGSKISDAYNWCYNNGIGYNPVALENNDISRAGKIASQSVAAGGDKHTVSSITFEYYGPVSVGPDKLKGAVGKSESALKEWCNANGIYNYVTVEGGSGTCGTVVGYSPESGTTDTKYTFTIAPHNMQLVTETESTCSAPGTITYKCATCDKQATEQKALADHSFGEWSAYDGNGTRSRTCGVCGHIAYDTIACENGFDVNAQACIVVQTEQPSGESEE